MTPNITNNVTVSVYGNMPHEEAVRHAEVAQQVVSAVTEGSKSKTELLVSKVSKALLDKHNAFFFKVSRLSAKIIKKLLTELLPAATIKVVKIAGTLLITVLL